MNTLYIDLNADLGEAVRDDGIAIELQMLDYVTSCNIACGGHAGDESSMARMVRAAKVGGVAIGAHPSYPDRENFGRKVMDIPPADLRVCLLEQLQALESVAAEHGAAVTHVKPHGALYNEAADDGDLAALICEVVHTHDPALTIFGMASSEIERAAKRAGLKFIAEGFIDRSYTPKARLTPRSQPGALIETPEAQTQQMDMMVHDGAVETSSGQRIALKVQTLCLHSDTKGADTAARTMRTHLESKNVTVKAYNA